MRPSHGGSRRGVSRRAFSLIELLLVLVILTVLATLVAPRFVGTTEEARIKTAKTQLADFGTALKAFEIACGRFPTSEEGLDALLAAPANANGWSGPYLDIDQVPLDAWGNAYIYVQPGQHRVDYDIYSSGPDGKVDTDDDIANWTKG